jgi:two-component system, cell cycle sensor histidine kinase and response regulator CckA
VEGVIHSEPLRVLLIEDDEDDYILTRTLFAEIRGKQIQLVWAQNYTDGLQALLTGQHQICLADYRLGAKNGIDLIQEATDKGCPVPIILLTGQGEREVDLMAMKAGASDYLVKGRLDADLLERSIRYAVERKRSAITAANEQARLASFGADIGLALTRRDSLDAILQRCATAMVQYLNAALARLWIFDREENTLKLLASAGTTQDVDLPGFKKPKVFIDIEQLKQDKSILISQVMGEYRVPDQAWVRREGIASFAAHPLMLEDRLVGLMSMFSRNPLSQAIIQEMSSVANGIAICVDRKRSAEALDASEIKYRTVVENIKEVIFQTNESGQWIFLNPAWSEITGYSVKDSIGTKFSDYIHPEDQERHADLMMEVIERKKSYCRDEARYRAKDGTFRWVEVYAQPTFDGDGAVLGASGTISDITERRRAEAEIKKLAAFPRFNPDPVLELASDGTLTYLNNAAREMAESLGAEEPEAILPPESAAIARECLRRGQSKVNQERKINGRTLSWSFLPILANQVVHCYGSDVTDRLNLEAQLRHSQKMESVGQLAAGVAHDFNNILTIIQGHSDLLLAACGEDGSKTESLQQVSDAAKRASTLTRQLLTFSRKQVMQSTVMDLNTVLGNMTKMLVRLLGDDIALESKHASELPSLEADTGMVEQVILNLAVNARDAMPKGGRLHIATTEVTIDETYVQQHPDARTGRFICLSVTDTGCGMSKDTVNRIFEPFFTTKEVGKGTGLGLATVYGVVKQHLGWIEVSSELGVGTTFKVFFPASDKKTEGLANESVARSALRGNHEIILLVEDEPVLRELARTVLSSYDYTVIEASNGVEALRVFQEHEGKIDLLLTDMVMPEGMTGRDLAGQLKTQKPELKIIYTSGYSADVMGEEGDIANAMFLQKPYPPPQLAQTVRRCLDEKLPKAA